MAEVGTAHAGDDETEGRAGRWQRAAGSRIFFAAGCYDPIDSKLAGSLYRCREAIGDLQLALPGSWGQENGPLHGNLRSVEGNLVIGIGLGPLVGLAVHGPTAVGVGDSDDI